MLKILSYVADYFTPLPPTDSEKLVFDRKIIEVSSIIKQLENNLITEVENNQEKQPLLNLRISIIHTESFESAYCNIKDFANSVETDNTEFQTWAKKHLQQIVAVKLARMAMLLELNHKKSVEQLALNVNAFKQQINEYNLFLDNQLSSPEYQEYPYKPVTKYLKDFRPLIVNSFYPYLLNPETETLEDIETDNRIVYEVGDLPQLKLDIETPIAATLNFEGGIWHVRIESAENIESQYYFEDAKSSLLTFLRHLREHIPNSSLPRAPMKRADRN